ncbi:MAG: SsrA-binding protein SsrA-binding protein [Parcubacteria group bacterium]|nr:SsrA-binding protein SsrA-binding protein [Parcubacteria group bacterium]
MSVENRKARFDYEILERFTAGLELLGTEVKAVRAGKISLVGAFVIIRGKEAFLQGARIETYQPNNLSAEHDPDRPKKLLLSTEEIATLEKADKTKGLTIVPIKVYNTGRFLKLELGIARGKKEFDKRQAIKKRDTERDLKRTL